MIFLDSTTYGGDGPSRAVWKMITSFSGSYYDGEGNMLLNSPKTVKAIEFLRDFVAKGYVPEVVFAGGFQEEEALKDASVGAIPTVLFRYRYIYP